MTKQDFLNQCFVSGNTVHIPREQIDSKLYAEIKKAFHKIGGKWKGGKIWGFVFTENPTPLLESLQNGDERNIKKEFQFFETPPQLADRLVELLKIPEWKNTNETTILEPSAGKGRILDAIIKKHPLINTCAIELRTANREHLAYNYQHVNLLMERDFLMCDMPESFDYIVANPPFTKNQDIMHIKKMYECLKPGGSLVSMASPGFTFKTDKQSREFKEWFEGEVYGWTEKVERGAFKESGTMVETVIVVIDK